MRPRAAAMLVVLAIAVAPGARGDSAPCSDHRPFASVPGADLEVTAYVSKDAPPVHYEIWRGTIPSFDGMPISVDVTIPCGVDGVLPLVTMNHGWTDDKTIWQETGRSDTVSSSFRRGSNHHWNNIWFASKGYAVLNYTARGWHDSCGPATPGALGPLGPAPQCLAYAYWIHMDDQRWEIRDAQWLTAALVESGVADPSKLAITGGSYGGGVTIMAALLNDRIVCGGAEVPPYLGVDPCAGASDGEMRPWTTRATTEPSVDPLPLRWAAAIPMYTWGDVIQALVPNGRGADGHLGPDGDHASPVGVPIQSFLAGLYAAGQPLGNGYFAPPGVDPTADITALTARTLAGDPFLEADPLVALGIKQFRRFKSAILIEPNDVIPIMWVQGFTDPLFTAFEPIQIANKLRAFDPEYPIKLFFGDFGHDYAAERIDEWDVAKGQMNEFLDHHLFPELDGPPMDYDVHAAVTRCLDPDQPMQIVSAPDWGSLSTETVTFARTEPGVTSTAAIGRRGFEADPVVTATLPGPQSYKGCRITSTTTDPGVVAMQQTLPSDLVMIGGPVVEVTFSTTAPGSQLNVRLWDVSADGTNQGLVTRGTYRVAEGPATGLTATFQIAPTGYRFKGGHRLLLEVTGNDAPYRRQNNMPATIAIDRIELTLPVASV